MVTATGSWVQFSFYRANADHVELVGDFTDWHVGQIPMRRQADGHWTIALRLPSGEYKFRYWADGQWFCDYAAFGIEYGPFGPDSVLWVSPPAQAPAVAAALQTA